MRASICLLASVVALAACGGASAPTTTPRPTPSLGPTNAAPGPKPIDVIPSDEISDADGDGVIDSADSCPNDPEDHDAFEDGDGCPEPDNDKDGIADALDKCPNDAETYNGKEDEDGCPDNAKLVIIGCPEPPIVEYVHFAPGSAKIPPAAKLLLDTVAQVMANNPQVLVAGVEGFADDPVGPAANIALSQKRADVVMKELVARGVDAGRLRAKGFGAYCPIDDAKTPAGKEHNRRVGFHVLETTSGIAPVPAGCTEATKHGLVLTP